MIFSKLSECCEFIKDGTHSSPVRAREGIPVLSASNVVNGHLNYNTDRFTTDEELRLFRQRLKPQKSDVLLTIVGTIGRVAILTENRPLVFQRSVCVFRPKKTLLDSLYLRYVLESSDVKKQLDHETHEVAQAGVYLEPLNKIEIPLPPFSEQKRIAAILEKADHLRRQRRYALELSDTYLQTVFLEMFGDPTMNQRHWELNLLSKEGVLDRGKSQHRPRDAAHLYGGPYPFIQTGDVANSNGLITQYSQTYSEAGLAQSHLWKKGTLCITIAANIAKTAILDFDACFPDSIVGFIPGPGVTVEYVRQWFVNIQNRLEKVAPQSAQKNINLEILRNLQIPVPPSTLQQQFAQIVQKYQRLRTQQREAERQAEHLFQTLLHRAFQGELELEDSAAVMAGEQGRYTSTPDQLYTLPAPAKLIVKETEQLALPMD